MADLKEEEFNQGLSAHAQTSFYTSRPLAWACALEDYLLSNGEYFDISYSPQPGQRMFEEQSEKGTPFLHL